MTRHGPGWTAAAALLFAPMALHAQQPSATLRGIVAGPDGQPFMGAVVTLFDRLGVHVAATASDAAGRFTFPEIAPGAYTLVADTALLRSAARVVTVQGAPSTDIELTLAAQVAESVMVQGTADAPSVTTRMSVAGEGLPQMSARLPSRAVQQLLATLPGWASEDNGVLHVRGVDDGFLFVRDGVPVYERLDALFGMAPDPAGIGTMTVLTGHIPAEFGLKSGAVIELESPALRRAGWAATVDAGVGSDGLRSGRSAAGGPIGRRASLDVNVASERSKRFLDPVHPENLHNAGGLFSGEAHLSVIGSGNDIVRINVGGGRSRYQVPHGEVQELAGQDQRQRLRQDSQSGSWQRFWPGATASQLAVYRRQIGADLRASVHDTPLSASSGRQQERVGLLGSLTHQRGRQTLKVGFEASRLTLQEGLSFAVTDRGRAQAAEIGEGAAAFTLDNPFRFEGGTSRMQWSVYGQDQLSADRVTVDIGIRFDRTRLLVPAAQWSPRLGVAYHWPDAGRTLRASLNRFFQPPQPEHLLLSSSKAARALSPFADGGGQDDQAGGEAGGAALEPERQTAWEVGLEQRLAGGVRADVAYWSRHVRNYADPNVFFGTTIVFPTSVARGQARGVDMRLELAPRRGWSGYLSYTRSAVVQVGPINGGLFLEETLLEIGRGTRFTPDHDQRDVAAAGVTYQNVGRGFSAALAVRHESGTPLEVGEDDMETLRERPGAALVDFAGGRVRPRTVAGLTLSQVLQRGARAETSVRLAVLNLTDRAYALNFGNPFSGTHFGAPRALRAELSIRLR